MHNPEQDPQQQLVYFGPPQTLRHRCDCYTSYSYALTLRPIDTAALLIHVLSIHNTVPIDCPYGAILYLCFPLVLYEQRIIYCF